MQTEESFLLFKDASRLTCSACEEETCMNTYTNLDHLGKLLKQVLHFSPAGFMICGWTGGLFLCFERCKGAVALLEAWFHPCFTIYSICNALGCAVGAIDSIDSIGLVFSTLKSARELAKHF